MKRLIPILLFTSLWICRGIYAATPTVDTTATTTSSSSSYTLSLNDGGPGRQVFLAISYASLSAISTAPSGGSGLSWTLVKAVSNSPNRLELWTAYAATKQTSQTITITLPSSIGSATLLDTVYNVDNTAAVEASASGTFTAGGVNTSFNCPSVTTASNNAYVMAYSMQLVGAPISGSGYTATSTANNAGASVGVTGQLANSATATSGTTVTPTMLRGSSGFGASVSMSIKQGTAPVVVTNSVQAIMF